MWYNNLGRTLFRFERKHALDGRTDRTLMARPRRHSMQRGKMLCWLSPFGDCCRIWSFWNFGLRCYLAKNSTPVVRRPPWARRPGTFVPPARSPSPSLRHCRSDSAVTPSEKVQLTLIVSPLRAFQWAKCEHRTLSKGWLKNEVSNKFEQWAAITRKRYKIGC